MKRENQEKCGECGEDISKKVVKVLEVSVDLNGSPIEIVAENICFNCAIKVLHNP